MLDIADEAIKEEDYHSGKNPLKSFENMKKERIMQLETSIDGYEEKIQEGYAIIEKELRKEFES